jgi:hypothetical protein
MLRYHFAPDDKIGQDTYRLTMTSSNAQTWWKTEDGYQEILVIGDSIFPLTGDCLPMLSDIDRNNLQLAIADCEAL